LKLPPQEYVAIKVEWSAQEPIRLWVEGYRVWEPVRLGEFTRPPGDTAITVVVPASWRTLDGLYLKVGLPVGDRFSGSTPIPVVIEVRS